MNENESRQNQVEENLLIIQGLDLLHTKVLQQRTLVDIKRTKQAEDEPLIEYYTLTVYRIQMLIRNKKEIIKNLIHQSWNNQPQTPDHQTTGQTS